MKNDKYTLTELRFEDLSLSSRSASGVRVQSEEHEDEESTSLKEIWTRWTSDRLVLIVINRIAD